MPAAACLKLVLVFVCAASVCIAGEAPARPWNVELLRDEAAWPHADADARIAATSRGLRVEIAQGRRFAIAACSHLKLPGDLGRVRVRVAELGNGATWFVRLYGELRIPGDRRTVGLAQDETAAGERIFHLDPRFRQLPDAPLQFQLGVEGAPGAFVVFEDVAFLPAAPRPNVRPRVLVQPGQKDIPAVELMPNLPEPYDMIDWRAKARAYDAFVFDFAARGEFLPLVWLDEARINMDAPTFGLPSYVGDVRLPAGRNGAQEGITCMGAVLGATLAGIDKRAQAHDYVAMCAAWFNAKDGLVLNLQRQGTGGSFWYELWPHMIFYALVDKHPEKTHLAEIMRTTAGRWIQACGDLAGADGIPDFEHTSYDFATRKAVDNGQWKEPDAAAGVAWLEYMAYRKFGDVACRDAAARCLAFLERRKENPYYEILLPYGALAAARLAAEEGRASDVDKLLGWCFDVSDCRGGWSVTVGAWGGYDCDGLLGSIDNRGGYAFAMNTFAQAAGLVPLVRYDPRYARAIGKWILNLANAARLFYPGTLPPDHQSSGFWQGDPGHIIAYEGLRREWQGKSPCATGDPVYMKWGPKTDLGLYGSGFVGMLGAIVRTTDVRGILALDCLATDFFRDRAYPTFLCYNPYGEEKAFVVEAGEARADLFDAVTRTFVRRDVRGKTLVTLPPDSALLIVVAPASGEVVRGARGRISIDGVIVAHAPAR